MFCFLRFPSGLVAHLHLSWLDPHKERRFTVVGSKRMATFDDMALERKLTVYDKGFDEDARTYGEYITRSGDSFSPQIANVEPLRVECEHFVESIRQGTHAALGRRERPARRARARGAAALARRVSRRRACLACRLGRRAASARARCRAARSSRPGAVSTRRAHRRRRRASARAR